MAYTEKTKLKLNVNYLVNIDYPIEYLQLLAGMFSTSWKDEAYILGNK